MGGLGKKSVKSQSPCMQSDNPWMVLQRGKMTVSSCEKLKETYPHRFKTVMFLKVHLLCTKYWCQWNGSSV